MQKFMDVRTNWIWIILLKHIEIYVDEGITSTACLKVIKTVHYTQIPTQFKGSPRICHNYIRVIKYENVFVSMMCVTPMQSQD